MSKNRGAGRPPIEWPRPMLRDLVFEVLKGGSQADVAATLNRKWALRKEDYSITPAQVLPLFRKYNPLFVVPKLTEDEEIAQQVAEHFGLGPDMVEVEMSADDLDAVARRAACALLHKIRHHDADVVRVGFGAGVTTELVAMHLGRLLAVEDGLPQVVIHVLSKSLHTHKVHCDPISFAAYFTNVVPKVEFVGLPTAPIADVAQGMPEAVFEGLDEDVLGNPYALKWEIDVIVSALATWDDPNSEHSRVVRACGMEDEARRKQIVGDVAYNAFSEAGKVEFETGWRIVRLFDFDELLHFVSIPGKDLLLVAGPTGDGGTRHEALRPLLEKDFLRVLTRLITDRATCRALLRK